MKLADLHIGQPDTICDFCSGPLGEKPRLYHAVLRAIIPLEDAIIKDDGEWLACPSCANLKDSNRWKELLVRSVDSIMRINNVPEIERPETIRRIYSIWQKAFELKENIEKET